MIFTEAMKFVETKPWMDVEKAWQKGYLNPDSVPAHAPFGKLVYGSFSFFITPMLMADKSFCVLEFYHASAAGARYFRSQWLYDPCAMAAQRETEFLIALDKLLKEVYVGIATTKKTSLIERMAAFVKHKLGID